MRAFAAWALVAAGCNHAPEMRPPITTGPTLELTLDDGRPGERPLTPQRSFETLMRFAPLVSDYIPLRFRFLLAQPGFLIFTVYAGTLENTPGAPLARIERDYDASLCSSGSDGRWVVEALAVPVQRAPVWIGISTGGDADPRLWASSNNSGAVFARNGDPTARPTERLPRTPILRLEVAPAAPPLRRPLP
jgi:hypothetical protein